MIDQTTLNRRIAMLGLRWVLGFLSMLLGYYKIFLTGLDAEFKWFLDLQQWFPVWLLHAVNYYTAFVELIAGFLLVIGFKRDWALYLILSVLVIVTFGHSVEHEIWDLHQLVFRLAMLLTLLLTPAEWDYFRLERFLRAPLGTRK
jgi:uncharacterized membrane protein YphA (DoxX/SURF4 family)